MNSAEMIQGVCLSLNTDNDKKESKKVSTLATTNMLTLKLFETLFSALDFNAVAIRVCHEEIAGCAA